MKESLAGVTHPVKVIGILVFSCISWAANIFTEALYQNVKSQKLN